MKKNVLTSIQTIVAVLLILVSFPLSAYADRMDDTVEEAVELLKDRGLGKIKRLELIIEIINKDSQQFDREARLIQSSLYSTLQSKFPQAKLMLREEAIAGISSRAIMLKGAYQQRKGKVFITFRAIGQMEGEMIAKADVEYASEQKSFKNLVVVMPLEARTLDKPAISAFSTIFRSALINTRQFDLVSSDAIDNADPEKIQATYKCSREECSTIVAQQLNASRVITTSYRKISSKLYFLSGSLKNISTGRTTSEESIKHDGNLETLDAAFEKLACQLANTCGQSLENTTQSVGIKIGKKREINVNLKKIPKAEIISRDVVIDNATGLMWQDNHNETMHRWKNAISNCDNLILGGYSDWRLPNEYELEGLYHRKSILKSFVPSDYWSSTTQADRESRARDVDFEKIHEGHSYKIFKNYVRCVRGEQKIEINDDLKKISEPKVAGSDVVTDKETGLMWQDNDYQTIHGWDSAISYCDNLVLGGYSDWRLPEKDELEGIYHRKSILKFYESSGHWSSDNFGPSGDLNYAVYFSFKNGREGFTIKSVRYNVRCVRNTI